MSKKFDLTALRKTVQGLTRRGIEPNAQTLGTILVVTEALGTPVTAVQEGKAAVAKSQANASRARQSAGKTRQATDQRISDERAITRTRVAALQRQLDVVEILCRRSVSDARAVGQPTID